MSVTLPSEIGYGFVMGRWVLAVADTPAADDHLPDAKPASGTVQFIRKEPTSIRPDTTQTDGTYVGTIKRPIETTLDEHGELALKDADRPGVWLIHGAYTVRATIDGASWPVFDIVVGEEHTESSPLDLLAWSPIVETPTVRLVVSEELALRAEAAAVRAEEASLSAWEAVDTPGRVGPEGPQGPQGPPGEVTTAALTTALAGKVTGQGMEVRLDTSVGTRVLLDHPGGSTMLWGDTGWRDMSSYLPLGITGTFQARRTLHATDVKLNVTLTADSTLIGGRKSPVTDLIRDLPVTMFPYETGAVAPLIMRDGSSGAPTGTVVLSFQSPTATRMRITSSSPGNWEAGTQIRISGTIPNDQPWPDTQPGTP